ncbi:MAG TPA: GLUG motif-containing protein [Sedimentisphaerales bacterium]|nr:GLUG motif-containing protein [Sedimentisphaerales bacterium]
MKRLIVILVSIVLILGPVKTAGAFSGSGSGTEPDPYIITDVNQLQEMQYALNAWYELGNGIDASKTKTWNSGEGFVPVGDAAHPFVGHFQGNGFTISRLYIKRLSTDYVGLFGKMGTNAAVERITLADPNAMGNNYTASLVGYTDTSLSYCDVSGGYVKGNNYVGGLIGQINNSMSDCNSLLITVYGADNVGGLAGHCTSVSNCASSGLVQGNAGVGGLVGYANGSIENSDSQAGVLGTGENCGGLGGYHTGGLAANCYAAGSVTGSADVGALFGENAGTSIDKCYAAGNVGAAGDNSNYGGLVGRFVAEWVTCDIINCHAAGAVDGHTHVGGLVGYIYSYHGAANINNCYSTANVTGSGTHVGGLIGREQQGYAGDCTSTDSYSTGSVYGSGNYVGGFIGYYDYCNITDCYTLGNVHGEASNVGGMGGYAGSGSINRCYAKGQDVEGASFVGGLLGQNSQASISQSYSVMDVNSLGDDAGGLIGYNNGSVENCYARGTVIGADYVGGFAGENADSGDISKCYSTGSVTGVYNVGGFAGWSSGSSADNYWDIETSGRPTSPGAEGKFTEEMMQQSTFEPAWDFEAVWGIEEGLTYPVLLTISHTPTCGDPWHPYPVGDLNHDCHVNFLDFAAFSSHWLEDTAPQ